MRILLVEDERRVASFIARTLRENAYAVDVADTGEKGLELGKQINYDAILLDVRLPGMSGVEVCRELRRRGVAAPVMMLTARALVEQRVEGLDTGADDYLTKPFVLAVDAIVIGAGMYGSYVAEKIYRQGQGNLRVLLLEAGSFSISEHVQNLSRIGLNAAGPITSDPGTPRERVWGLPWRSNVGFPGLAYCVGGRSLYWGGWSPRLTDADLKNWPTELQSQCVDRNSLGIRTTPTVL
jgi:CheY-like chemotaxis protein